MEIENLVERITREVMASLGGAPTPASAPAPVSGRPLVVFAGDANELRCFVSDVGLSPQNAILALPRDSRVRRSEAEDLKFSRVVYMDEAQHPVELVHEADRLMVPVYRFNQLANLAGLCDSCWDVRLILKALTEKRSVQLLLGQLETASPFQSKIDSYVREIRGYGIEVVQNPQSGGGGLGPAPRGAVLHAEPGHQHKDGQSHSPCQLKAVGECAGLGHCSQHLPERVGIIVEQGADRVSSSPGGGVVAADTAPFIDHTLLKPDATREEVLKLCDEARQHSFASVCVNPGFVALAADALRGTTVKVCTVVGFPLGATTTVTKAMETRDAVANGADEIDMVINVGQLKARNDDFVRRDIEAVVEAAGGRIVKVILETALLNDEEKVRASKLSQQAGADFVKTSTGFGPGGATAHDVSLMRQTVGRYMGVKASGGIRDFAVAQEMLMAGATRIGASASVKIVKGEMSDPRAAGKY